MTQSIATKSIWQEPVADHLGLVLVGRNMIKGRIVVSVVSDLLAEARAVDNSVSGGMTLKELTDWHSDYQWSELVRL